MEEKHLVARRNFLTASAAIGAAAIAGNMSENLWAEPAGDDGLATEVYARIAGKTHFITVRSWFSENVVGATKSGNDDQKRAVVSRLVHENEKFLDIITHGGEHIGNFRLYVDLPGPKLEGEVVHAAADEKSSGGCY